MNRSKAVFQIFGADLGPMREAPFATFDLAYKDFKKVALQQRDRTCYLAIKRGAGKWETVLTTKDIA